MSRNLRNCVRKLAIIAEVKNRRLQTQLLKDISCEDKIYKALKELALNVRDGNIPLTRSEKQRLKRYKSRIKALTCKVTSKKKRRKIVTQSGGWLGILIPTVLSILSTISAEK